MKNITLKLMIILFAISGLMNSVLAQAPEGIIYQAEARDGLGQPIINQALDVKISIIQDNSNGFVVYEEFHLVTTNDYGMFDLVIGEGTNNLGLLEDVDWGNHIHFLNVQVKKTIDIVWINMGTGQLLSVPYALYAKTAENLNDGENDPVFQSSPAFSITSDDITKLSNLSGVNTGDQDLSDLASKTDLNNKVDKVAGKDLFPKGTAPGQMKYWNGSEWVNVAQGTTGQVLTFINGVPTWSGTGGGINDVYNPATGKIWMDRNLGASQVATSSKDEAAYGDLYQWGRATDGHEIRTSSTTTTLSISDTPGHGNFILAKGGSYDWRSSKNDNLWQGISGINNPCPSGYRLPTEAEWQSERASWTSDNAAGAFASPLKLTLAGYRDSEGWLFYERDHGSDDGYYWSSTVSGTSSIGLFLSVCFDNGSKYCYPGSYASMSPSSRANGFSVRCLKEARTAGSKLSLTTAKVTNVKSTTAFTGGEIASGNTYVTARGMCWSTAKNPTIDLPTKTQCGKGGGSFTSTIAGLKSATTYYVRAYATNSDGTTYGNEVSFTTLPVIGDTYQGGIVAYILKPSDPGYVEGETHGLIAAPNDQSTGIQWYNGSFTETGAIATKLGTGNANTNKIVASYGEGSYAAKLCADLVLGGYSDWFLPSMSELDKLYLSNLVGYNYYWSSSELETGSPSDLDLAWGQLFYDGSGSTSYKSSEFYVRAVRAF